jgi:NitT/TauT family transport system substrate-binding protein
MRILVCFALFCAAFWVAQAQSILRVDLFPNVTHAQALVAKNLSAEGKGWFEERLGQETKIEWFIYNAGPSAMEAIFARSLDLTYVGPSPVVNAYARAKRRGVRIVAGAMRGGEALVVRGDTIKNAEDFRGKAIATPQLGNTQDVECRAWLIDHGIRVTMAGGDARVLPTANPDILALFQQGKLDAAWTVEPWVSRLLSEAGGRIFFEPENTVTTVLAGREEFLSWNPQLCRKFALAHRDSRNGYAIIPRKRSSACGTSFPSLRTRRFPCYWSSRPGRACSLTTRSRSSPFNLLSTTPGSSDSCAKRSICRSFSGIRDEPRT